MTELATIGLRVDSDGVVRATGNLDAFVAAAERTDAQSKRVVDSLGKLGRGAGQTAGATDRLNNTQQRGAQTASRYAKSQREVDQAMRLLPAQVTDIVTSLISGQPAYLVAIQQGGQLKDSFGGIGPAIRALLGYFSPLTLGLLGIATAGGSVILAIKQGQDEAEEFNRELILTGNAAGVTAGHLSAMAVAISDIVGTRGQASEVLGELASTGRIGGDNMQRFAQITVAAERVLGTSTEEMAKQFAELAKDPLTASVKLNESLNYLTASTIEQIDALMRAGKETDAARVAQEAYANAIASRTSEMNEHVGSYASAWTSVKDAILGAWDAYRNFVRPNSDLSDEERLQQLTRARGDRILGSTQTNSGRNANLGELASMANDAEERRLRERVEFLAQGARNQAEFNQRTREGNAARERNNRLLDESLTKQQKLNRDIAAYERDQELMRRGGFTVDTPEQREQALSNIRSRYADRTRETDFGIGADLPYMEADAMRPLEERIEAESNLLEQSLQQWADYHEDLYQADIDAAARQKAVADSTAEYRQQQIDDMVAQADGIAGVLGLAGDAMYMFGKRGFKAFQALKIAEALVSIPSSAMKAYESALAVPVIGPALAPAAAAGAVAFQLGQIAQIRAAQPPGFMTGGYTGNGGRGEVAGVVHGQEYVLNAQATQRYRGILDQMNSGAAIPATTIAAAGGRSNGGDWVLNVENHGEPMDMRIKRVVGNVITVEQVPAIIDTSVQRSAVAVGASIASRSGPVWDGVRSGTTAQPRPDSGKVRG